MVTKWGLSTTLGPLAYSEDEGEVFLGRSVTQHKQMSDDTAHAIDKEIREFIDRNYQRAETILKENMDILHSMAKALMKYETIDSVQIAAIMAGEPIPPPSDWNDDDSSDNNGDGGNIAHTEVKPKDNDKLGKTAESH
jgi:cell division protease FtsH